MVAKVIKKICNSDYFINIIGLKDVTCGNVNDLFDEIERLSDGYLCQILDANAIAGVEHLYFAAVNASKAFNQGLNISKNFSIEFLLYVSGQRQISKAIGIVGVKHDTREIALVIFAQEEEFSSKAIITISKIIGGIRDDDVLEIRDPTHVAKLFGLENSYDNIATLKSLLIERSALLITQF